MSTLPTIRDRLQEAGVTARYYSNVPFLAIGGTKYIGISALYDHTSVLKLIEWRFGLEPLTARDASDEIANPALALRFTSPEPSVPWLR